MSRREKLSKFLFSLKTEAVEGFVAKENFVDGKKVKEISFYEPSHGDFAFGGRYLEKTEKNVEAVELKVHELLISARYFPTKDKRGIMPKLAGKHEVMLAQFYQLLVFKQQKKDFTAVIARSINSLGKLTILNAYWLPGDGCSTKNNWFISSESIAHEYIFDAGTQVAFI